MLDYNDGKFVIWIFFWVAVFILAIVPAILSLLGNLKDAITEYLQKRKEP